MEGNGRRGLDVGKSGPRVALGGASGDVGGELEGLRGDETDGVLSRRGGDASGKVAEWKPR